MIVPVEAHGFLRYPLADHHSIICRWKHPDLYTPYFDEKCGVSGGVLITLCGDEQMEVDFRKFPSCAEMVRFVERTHDPSTPDVWTILNALFPRSAQRVDKIMLWMGKQTLLRIGRAKETS